MRILAVRPFLFPAGVALAIAVGALVRVLGPDPRLADGIWLGALIVAGLPLVGRTALGVFRGRWAADLVAALAIIAAIILGQGLAGLVVVLMQSGGESLETHAAGRASRALRALEDAAPRRAHRITSVGVQDIDAADVAVGDDLLIRPGEMIPCDGIVVAGRSHVDTSAITGEPVPRRATTGTTVVSGMLNQEGAITIRASARAEASQYARIVELVRTAQRERAPIQRIADRYAVWFTPITLAICAVTVIATGDWHRTLAILVVATPCPLLLATPVAMLAGIDLAARRRLIVRSGAALEALASVTCAVFDKTGTVTLGRPAVSRVRTIEPWTEREVLRVAGSVEQRASHLLARSLVEAAEIADVDFAPAEDVIEAAGQGVAGSTGGWDVAIGSRSFLARRHPGALSELDRLGFAEPGLRAGVTIDGAAAAVIEFADRVRADARAVVAAIGAMGLTRRVLLSGDHAPNAEAVARELGFPEYRGDLLPEEKVEAVRSLEALGERVVMLGDGTNDAPALAAATVGVAIAGQAAAGVATEAADVVILTESPAPLADAIRIGRRTLSIARQSIIVGLGLSGVAVFAASLGYIPPVAGALLQEAIDIAVILNALRASSLPPAAIADPASAMPVRRTPTPGTADALRLFEPAPRHRTVASSANLNDAERPKRAVEIQRSPAPVEMP